MKAINNSTFMIIMIIVILSFVGISVWALIPVFSMPLIVIFDFVGKVIAFDILLYFLICVIKEIRLYMKKVNSIKE